MPHLVYSTLFGSIQFAVSDRVVLEEEANLVATIEKILVSDMLPDNVACLDPWGYGHNRYHAQLTSHPPSLLR